MLYRKQLLLDEEANQNLLLLASITGKSDSYLVRESINKQAKEIKKKTVKAKNNGAWAFVKLAEKAERLGWTGPGDLSTNDDYIYR
ncbi:hypothetical protein HYS82_00465 [Candidatus Amesbacteria bacterium]|nr:hypothetical protein [Candidatus Amesbacteria bacterium]